MVGLLRVSPASHVGNDALYCAVSYAERGIVAEVIDEGTYREGG